MNRGVKRNRGGKFKYDKEKTAAKHDVDENSAVIQMFRRCQESLDMRHDKHERIVKLSRDVTIESKRIIFQLHRITGSLKPEVELKEAEEKLKDLQSTKWKSIAKELRNEDSYQFLRAYSPGLQEYIEAMSFWFYLKEKKLVDLDMISAALQFEMEMEAVLESPIKENDIKDEISAELGDDRNCPTERVCVHVPPSEYMLGIADLTGELMRMAINSLGSGDLDVPFELCSFMRVIHDAFVSFGNVHQRELTRKLSTLKQSMKKVETACYTLQVRGSEIPTHMLKHVFGSSSSAEVPGQFDDYVDLNQ